MRILASAGLGLSLLATVLATPVLANPVDLELKPGNNGPGAAANRGGPPIGNRDANERRDQIFNGGQRGNGGPRPDGGQRFGGGQRPEGGQRFGGGQRFDDRQRFDGGYRRHGGGYGAAVGAGVAGLAAGAVIGGALSNQGGYYGGDYGYDAYPAPAPAYGYPGPEAEYVQAVPDGGDAEAYCVRRFRSYDRASGTYLGNDGYRHPCP